MSQELSEEEAALRKEVSLAIDEAERLNFKLGGWYRQSPHYVALNAVMPIVARVVAERDRARDAAVVLEQANAEALRLAQNGLVLFLPPLVRSQFREIVRVLGAGDD